MDFHLARGNQRQPQRIYFRQSAGTRGVQVGIVQGGPPSAISQSFTFQSGTSYTVTFAAAQGNDLEGQTIEVFLDNTSLGTFTPASTSYANLSTAPFTTIMGMHALKFAGVVSGDHTVFIDNVRSSPAATPISTALAETSEFSQCVCVSGAPSPTPTATATPTFTPPPTAQKSRDTTLRHAGM